MKKRNPKFKIGDRVICVRYNYNVPLGFTGTVAEYSHDPFCNWDKEVPQFSRKENVCLNEDNLIIFNNLHHLLWDCK